MFCTWRFIFFPRPAVSVTIGKNESLLYTINLFYERKLNGFKELYVTKSAIIICNRQEATALIHVTITSKHGGLEWRFCSTISQIRNSTRRTGKNGLFLVSIHLMRPRLSLTMFYSMETTFIFALDFHVFYILHKARTCISRCFVYICSTVHTVLVIVNSRRFLSRASHHESTKHGLKRQGSLQSLLTCSLQFRHFRWRP